MNRLVAILMLVQFVAQHFACCCTGCESAPQKSQQVTSISNSAQRSGHCGGCCHRHHDRRTQTETQNTKPAENDTPAPYDRSDSGSPQHHLCFASHIVFNSTGRAFIAPSSLGSGDFLLPRDALRRKLLESFAASRFSDDTEQPRFNAYERSRLGVYRI